MVAQLPFPTSHPLRADRAPLQSRAPKGSHIAASTCLVCERQLLESSARFCSLECQLAGLHGSKHQQDLSSGSNIGEVERGGSIHVEVECMPDLAVALALQQQAATSALVRAWSGSGPLSSGVRCCARPAMGLYSCPAAAPGMPCPAAPASARDTAPWSRQQHHAVHVGPRHPAAARVGAQPLAPLLTVRAAPLC